MFPFILPRFAPTAVPRVLAFRFRLRPVPFRSASLSIASLPVLITQPSASSFLPSVRFASQLALRPGSGSFRPPSLLPFIHGWFPVRFIRLRILGFLFVSFRPSPLRFPQLFHRCSPVALTQAFSFVSATFRLTSTLGFGYSAFRSSFSDFPRLASRWLLRYLRFRFRFSGSPFRSPWFPMKSFRFVCTRLPVRFLSSFPASLPQLFHWCFPFRFPLRDQRLTSASFRPLPL